MIDAQPRDARPLDPILKVLLILPYRPAAFMQADVDMLGAHFELDVLVHNRGKLRLALSFLRRIVLRRPDLLLFWFIVPSYMLPFTFLAKLLGVKVACITGGYDIVSMPSIGFGALRHPFFRTLLRLAMPLVDLALPFSESAAAQLRKYARPRNCRVVFPGVDTGFFSLPPSGSARLPLAVTVSPINAVSIRQKGLDTFVKAAQYAPQMRWVVVGRAQDGSLEDLRAMAGPNVEFIDSYLPVEELRALFRRASCYVQASLHEGFGIAVAEAMCCGAVPVVTRKWSLPEVAGELGSYVQPGDAEAVAGAALGTLQVGEEQRRLLRKRIEEKYPQARRERELVEALLDLVPHRGERTPNPAHGGAEPLKMDLGNGAGALR